MLFLAIFIFAFYYSLATDKTVNLDTLQFLKDTLSLWNYFIV